MWFFEWARHYAAAHADILCVPRATPHGSTDKWLAGGRASAVCSGAYNLSSNLWIPKDNKANCGGLSWIIDPEGNVLAQTDSDNPFATVKIDVAFSRARKKRNHVMYLNSRDLIHKSFLIVLKNTPPTDVAMDLAASR
jgi:N-carbamoylputrescine amidase